MKILSWDNRTHLGRSSFQNFRRLQISETFRSNGKFFFSRSKLAISLVDETTYEIAQARRQQSENGNFVQIEQ